VGERPVALRTVSDLSVRLVAVRSNLHLTSGLAMRLYIMRAADFLRDRLAIAGLDTYVLGLSGGVDSACSAALAVRAVGADRLLTVKLPSGSSSPASQRDAELVEESLAIPPQHRLRVKIGSLVDGWRSAVGDSEPHPLRMGNVAAPGMVVLWDVASKHRGIMLGTENRTENLRGYFTI
jgi:NAD+ synthase